MKKDIVSLLPEELEDELRQLGEPAYRAGQVFRWLGRGVRDFDAMSDLSKSLREKLKGNYSIYEQEINTHPRPQLLLETGTGNNTGKTKDCQKDRHPHLQGGDRAENRECDIKNPVGEEVRFISYILTGISYNCQAGSNAE